MDQGPPPAGSSPAGATGGSSLPGAPAVLRSPRSARLSSATAQPSVRGDEPEGDVTADLHGGISPSVQDRVFPIRSVVSVEPTPTPRQESHEGFPGFVPVSEHLPGGVQHQNQARRRYSSTSSASHYMPEGSPTESTPRLPRTPSYSGERRGRRASPRASAQPAPWHTEMRGDDASLRSESPRTSPSGTSRRSKAASIKSTGEDLGGAIITTRFQHVVTQEGHAVITGRDGETLQRCEDEPIHVPGAIQSFGLLIAVREIAEGKLQVRIVSENSVRIIGYTPQQLFALESLTDILSEEQTDNILDHIEFIKDSDSNTEADGPEVFTISIRHPQTRKVRKLWCAVHLPPANDDLVICEFELEDDVENPLVAQDDGTPDIPEDTLASKPTAEEYAESTINISKPLRVLRSARKKKSETAAMEIFNIMSQIESQLAAAPRIDTFLKILIGVVKELTGFHRVMIYQFDHEFNGRVVTELVDPRATKDLYKGLNFPASDIPKQARDLYRINKLRLLYDRDQSTARLVCRTVQDLEIPLDLTHAFLRAMSPIHIKYLGNMAVRSSMSISINAFEELWGLIACHSYGNRGMRVSFPIRKMCRLVGDIACRNIERLSYASRLQARKLINTVPTAKNPSGYIVASSEDLLRLFDADCGLLSIREETKILGRIENSQEALALLEYFRQRQVTAVLTTQDVRVDFPDLRYAPGFTSIAGLLLVPLSSAGSDFIVFFRKPQIREVKWAGNPYEKFIREGTEGYLEPRKSFKMWTETVISKCREWNEEQVETAAVLCLVYGKFIEVWRQKEAAIHSTQLTKLLLANSAHEVRTPLNAIINYLEIAMESPLDQETRDNLARSHSASKSLIYVINDLLDLTKIEEGNQVIKDDVFDLPDTVREATEPFVGDAKRKHIKYEVLQKPGVPSHVIGDQRRVRQVISNIVANAIQHTSEGSVTVETWLVSRDGSRVDIDFVISDTGIGMPAKKLDDIFRELEQVQSEPADNLPDMLTQDVSAIVERKGDSKQTLGYGLALVGRIVRNMNGQLRLKSEEGVGSRFVVQLSFTLPESSPGTKSIEGIKLDTVPPRAAPATPPPATEGEVMLVTKSVERASRPSQEISRSRRPSQESLGSVKSGKSGRSLSSFKSGSSARSDVDRLIDAIQEPHILERTGSTKSAKEPPISRPVRPAMARSSTSSGVVPIESVRALQAAGAPRASLPGESIVVDQRTPIRSIRVSDDQEPQPLAAHASRPLSVSFDLPPERPTLVEEQPTAEHLQTLVAEDDPVNCKIMQKRLQKLGHGVLITVNGEECASAYGEKSSQYDVILMDMQMPIVDGLTSTKMIRSFEKSHGREMLSSRAKFNYRVPIFAVSATLIESQRQHYIDAGFDGWILKPVDFKRLTRLFEGIVDSSVRKECVYCPGEWERGGWFLAAPSNAAAAKTTPDPMAPVTQMPGVRSFPDHGEDPFDDRISREQQRLNSLKRDAISDPSKPSSE